MCQFVLELYKTRHRESVYKVDESKNIGSFYSEIHIVVEKLGIQKIIVTEPCEYRVL